MTKRFEAVFKTYLEIEAESIEEAKDIAATEAEVNGFYLVEVKQISADCPPPMPDVE